MPAIVALEEGHGGLRASDADREQAVDVLKAAFVQGWLAKAEFETHVGRALASRTYAELAAVTAGIAAPSSTVQPPDAPSPGAGATQPPEDISGRAS